MIRSWILQPSWDKKMTIYAKIVWLITFFSDGLTSSEQELISGDKFYDSIHYIQVNFFALNKVCIISEKIQILITRHKNLRNIVVERI